MAREQRRRVAPNPTGRTNINRAAPSVRARPVDRTVVQQQSNSLGKLAKSLQAVSPGLNKYMEKKQNEFIEQETVKGAQAAMTVEDVDEAIAHGEMSPEQSPYFQQAFMKQAGINAGQRRARELAQAYSDPEQFNRETGDIDEFFEQNIKSDIEGLDDTDFAAGYLQSLRPAEEKIRNDFTEFHIEKVRAEAREQTYQSYFNTFATMGENGEYGADALDTLAENAQALNLEKSELNSIAFQAAATYALQGEGNPEVFELFKNKGKNGVGSLYFTSKYGEQIETAQKQAAALSGSSQARLNNQTKFAAEQEWRQKSEANGGVIDFNKLFNDVYDPESNPEGRLTPSQAEQIWNDSQEIINGKHEVNKKQLRRGYHQRAMNGDESVIDDVWADDNITYSQAASIEKTVLDGRAEAAIQKNIRETLKSDRSDLLHNYDKKDIEASAQSIFDEELQRTGNYRDAALSSLDELENSGVMPPQLHELLKRANPKNESTWVEAVNVYRALDSQSPAYLDQTFTYSGQISRFDYFVSRTEFGGAEPQQALEELSSMSDRDVEIGRNMFGNNKQLTNLYDKLDSEFGDSANFGELRRTAEDHIRSRLSMPDHPPFSDELVESTVERLKNRFVDINGTWIDRAAPGAGIADLDDAVEDFLPEYFAEANPNTALEAKRIVPDQNTSADGTWVVLDQNGLRLGRVDPKELVNEHKISTGDRLTQQEMERQGVKHRIGVLRDELDEIDDAQFGLRSYGEGEDDPRYKRNSERRQEVSRQIQELTEQLEAMPAPEMPASESMAHPLQERLD